MTHKLCYLVLGALLALVGWATPASAGIPEVTQSFYVPQAGDYGNPVEGDEAIQYFRACPNNDGDTDSTSLPNNARIKVVLRDVNGNGVPDISPADVCILFNGGTPVQGFSGVGADSVIANRQYNPAASCPDVRCVPADAPTDANGVTYITFTGPGGVRDPIRKWGHYDTELPVFVFGFKLSGRLTTASANGTYTLRIKNYDVTGGTGTVPLNSGELVSLADLNTVVGNLGLSNILTYWRDFDSNGEVDMTDLNMIIYHINHDCDTPSNP
jgi:hypothetical protein